MTATLIIALSLPAHAIFDNTCMLFNIASRDNPMAETWLSDSLFYLSAKKKRRTEIRKLTYKEDEEVNFTGQTESNTGSAGGVIDIDEVRFLPQDTRSDDNTKTDNSGS